MENLPQARTSNLVVQEAKSEILIHDLATNKAFCLNQTLALVFQMSDGQRSVAEISQAMRRELKIFVSEDLVWLALDQLKQNNLLDNSATFLTDFNGLSRRNVIKKVGLASMIMLPVISTLVAPGAAMAASQAIALLSVCSGVGNSGCASGLHCLNCLAGCPNGDGHTCCANNHPTVSRGPGQPTISSGACNTKSTCDSLGPAECCKGTATWTANGYGNLGVGGTCICD